MEMMGKHFPISHQPDSGAGLLRIAFIWSETCVPSDSPRLLQRFIARGPAGPQVNGGYGCEELEASRLIGNGS